MKKIIEEFDKQFPREKGMFWTPSYKGIIEYLRTVYFKAYRQCIQDVEKNKFTEDGMLKQQRRDMCELFVEHIENHLKDMNPPDMLVCCKICGKDIYTIAEESI